MKKVTVLGGGTGTFVVLSGLKNYNVDLAAVVSMMDSGGSTGRLRDQLGVLPPGDLRQCLVALSDAPLLWRKLFLYRFESGDLAGHNFGNIFLSALEKVSSSYDEVIDSANNVLKTKGKVFPITYEKTNMCVRYESGALVKTEGNIDKNFSEKTKVIKAFLEPSVAANPKALKRILYSDYLIIGPGDLYTSIIPILLVEGVKDVVEKAKTKIIYIMNLMTKSGQTTHYKASDHLQDIERYLGRKPDFLILNTGNIPDSIVDWYKRANEEIVVNDINSQNFKGKTMKADLVDIREHQKPQTEKFVDPRVRSILRHDTSKLAKVIEKLIL